MTAPCQHPSAVGHHPVDGPVTLTCSTCDEVLFSDPGGNTYEIEVNLMREKVDVLVFRSWTGRRWVNGEPYEGPIYLFLTTREYEKGNV